MVDTKMFVNMMHRLVIIIDSFYFLLTKTLLFKQPVTSTTNGVESNKYNYTVANNSNQHVQTDSSNDENDPSENVQIIYSIPVSTNYLS